MQTANETAALRLAQLAMAVLNRTAPPDIASEVADLLVRTLGVDVVHVLDKTADAFEIVAGGQATEPAFDHFLDQASRATEPVLLDPRFRDPSSLRPPGTRAGIGIGIRAGDEISGVIAAYASNPLLFEAEQRQLLKTAAELLGAMAAGNSVGVTSGTEDSELRLESLLKAIAAVVWEADPKTQRFLYVSPGAEQFSGYSVEDWCSDGFWKRFVVAEDQIVFSASRAAAAQSTEQDVEYRVTTADSRRLWIRDVVNVIDTDSTTRIGGFMVDVTELRKSRLRDNAQQAVSRVLASATSMDDAIPDLLRGMAQSLDWSVAGLWTPDDERTLVCTNTWYSADPDLREFVDASRKMRLALGEGLPGRVWESGELIWLPDVTRAASFPRAKVARAAGITTGIAFPIISGRVTVGVIELFAKLRHDRDEALIETLASVGTQIGQFIQRRAADSQLLFQKTLLEFEGEATLDGIAIISPEDIVLHHNRRFTDIWGEGISLQASFSNYTDAAMFPKAADAAALRVLMDDLRSDPSLEVRREIELVDGRILDCFATPVTSQTGVRFGRAWYFRDVTTERQTERALRENQDRLSFLARAGSMLAGTLDFEATLDNVARLSAHHLGDWAIVDLADRDGKLSRAAAAHSDPAMNDELMHFTTAFPVGSGMQFGPAHVAETGQPQLMRELTDDMLAAIATSDAHLESLERLSIKSVMCLPLIARGRTLGVLTIVSTRPDRRFNESDLGLARDLALRAGLAVDNARLYQDRARVARTLQQSLLPPESPSIPALDVAARFHPAGDGHEIGGDFYDVFQTAPDCWAITLGDVVGKGTEAAAMTALARYTLRAAAMTPGKPSETLAMLNGALVRQGAADKYCTAVYGHVQPKNGAAHVTLSCGGHPSPFLIRADGTVDRVTCMGTLLGLFDDIDLVDVDVELQPGESMVFYTDGVTEGRGPTVPFGEGMLRSLLEWSSHLGASDLASQIERKVLDYQQGWASDDIAILVIRVPIPGEVV